MSDNITLEMRVDAHDNASLIIEMIIANLKSLERQVRKFFLTPQKYSKFGLGNLSALAANQRVVSASAAKAQSDAARDLQARITTQSSTNPEATANKAAKHIQDSTLWCTHDQDYSSI